MKGRSCGTCNITSWALIVAGLSLGLQGLTNWDFFSAISGGSYTALRVIYVIVGIATIGVIARKMDKCKACNKMNK